MVRNGEPKKARIEAECLGNEVRQGIHGRATMPAELVPNAQIPGLAARVDTPEMFNVLRHLEAAGSIQNGGSLDDETENGVSRHAAVRHP
jgi:hypothetical protein